VFAEGANIGLINATKKGEQNARDAKNAQMSGGWKINA
jgi:hypothetical protein